MVTHLLGCAPFVVIAVISESSSSLFSFSFFTSDSIARFAKPSLSPPCLWHISECTMLRQASAEVGAVDGGGGICTISRTIIARKIGRRFLKHVLGEKGERTNVELPSCGATEAYICMPPPTTPPPRVMCDGDRPALRITAAFRFRNFLFSLSYSPLFFAAPECKHHFCFPLSMV